MSTAVAARNSKAVEEAARKRKRRVVIGVGVGAGVGLGLLALLWSKEAKANPRSGRRGRGGGRRGRNETQPEFEPPTDPTEPDPKPTTPKRPGRLGLTPASPGGGPGGGKGKGHGGPGGKIPGDDEPRRVNPGGGKKSGGKKSGGKKSGNKPRRTNPKVSPKRKNPKGGTTPKGPNPKIRDLDAYYNADWPDPAKFYQVGGQDFDGLYGIAWRWFYTCLFLAAKNAGGLDDEAAREWASARVGSKGAAQAERADFILCSAWNDIVYGSYAVAAKNRRGPHGRGIDLVPQHADNWKRIGQRKRVRRNVYLETPGTVGTPRNAGQGNAKLPLLWMPRLSDQVLWDSNGQTLKAGGSWAGGSSMVFPPPVVMNLGIDDATGSAGLSVWGCGEGEGNYG